MSLSEKVAIGAALIVSVVLHLAIAWPIFLGELYTYDDLTRYYLPTRLIYARCLEAGQDFRWVPDLFCGFYLQGEGQVGMDHPVHRLLYAILPLPTAFMLEVVLPYPVLQIGMYVLLSRCWKTGRVAALVGSMLFTFSGTLVLRYVHPNATGVLAHMPWLLWAADRGLRGGRDGRLVAWSAPLLALLTASQILLGYPQFTWYSGLAEVWYIIVLLAAGSPWRRIPVWVLAKALGVLSGGIQLLPMMHELSLSVRNQVSAGFGISRPEHWLNIIQPFAPYLFRARGYFPEVPAELGQYTHEAPLYLGSVAPVLIGWLYVRRGLIGANRVLVFSAAALAVAALGLTFIEATPLLDVYRRIPILRIFRVSARYFLLVQFSVAILAALAMGDLLRRESSTKRRGRLWPLFVPPALASVSALGIWGVALGSGSVDSRWLASPELALVGPALSMTACGLVLACARGSTWAPAALIVWVAVDLGAYGLSFLRAFPTRRIESIVAELPVPPSPNHGDRIQMTGRPIDRTSDIMIVAGHKLVGGYAGMMPRRVLDYDQSAAQRVAGAGWVLDYRPGPGGHRRWTPVRAPLPRVRFVTDVRASRDPAAELVTIDPARVALVPEPLEIPEGLPGSIQMLQDDPGRIELRTEAGSRQLLVLAERIHDGWQVLVDGEIQPIVPVYGDFLGVVVESGRHKVAFHFRPWSLQLGRLATISGLAGIASLFVIMRYRRKSASA